MSNKEKILVRILGGARVSVDQIVPMTREQYESLQRCIKDDPYSGAERALEYVDMNYADFDDFELDAICEVRP